MHDRVPPGSLGPPIVGQTIAFVRDPLTFMRRGAERYGPVFKAGIIGRPTVFMLGPQANRFVLSTASEHLSWRDGYGAAAQALFDEAFLMQEGPTYRRTKQTLTPTFARAAIERHLVAMHEEIEAELDAAARLERVELYGLFKRLALAIAHRVFVGTRPPDVEATRRDFDRFSAGLFTPFRWRIPGSTFGRAWQSKHRLRAALGRALEERRATGVDEHSVTLLDAFVAAGLSDEAIVSHLMLMLFAGHDTTASLATWLCREIAARPGVGERVRHELEEHGLPQARERPDSAQLGSLQYLGACIREAERLYPPAPTGFRGVSQPLQFGGFDIPAGWCVVYSPIYTHRMPSLFDDPDAFDPARPVGEPFEHVAFGGGPRKCPGEAMAHAELKAIFAHLWSHYDVELLDDRPPVFEYIPSLHPKHGSWARLRRRAA